MKRKPLVVLQLMLIALGWLPKTVKAQPAASFQQYYYYDHNAVTFAPIISYKANNDLYIEGRYNYEELNTFSMYFGKSFNNYEKNKAFSYSFTQITGLVFGSYRGVSVGANIYLDYKKLSLSTQPQYTLAGPSKLKSFLYSWNDLSYQLFNGLAIGISGQHTKEFEDRGNFQKGVFIEMSYKRFSVPLYAFNIQSPSKYFLLGLTYDWEGKKRKKQEEKKDELINPTIDSTAAVLANKTKEKSYNDDRVNEQVLGNKKFADAGAAENAFDKNIAATNSTDIGENAGKTLAETGQSNKLVKGTEAETAATTASKAKGSKLKGTAGLPGAVEGKAIVPGTVLSSAGGLSKTGGSVGAIASADHGKDIGTSNIGTANSNAENAKAGINTGRVIKTGGNTSNPASTVTFLNGNKIEKYQKTVLVGDGIKSALIINSDKVLGNYKTQASSPDGVKPEVQTKSRFYLYALTIGSYESLEKARLIEEQLLSQYKRGAIVVKEGGLIKIRMTGFVNRHEAEEFVKTSLTLVGEVNGLIQPYQVETLQF